MSVTVAIRFPLGRYHATPWDRSVNEGAVEWPPCPWRLLRTLVATWYTRWPELPAPVLDGLLTALGDPPAYRTPEASAAHTRHYLPDPDHKKGETGNTDLTLDPYLSVPQDEALLVRWDVELSGEQRDVLAKLVELVPYLGRAESICDARLLDRDEAPDETWWRPSSGGAQATRLLSPALPVRRALLELGTTEIRKGRRTMPPKTVWVTYGRTPVEPAIVDVQERDVTEADTVRFAVVPSAPLRATHGVLLADEVHRLVTRRLDGGSREVLGHSGAATDHQHAHWIPIPAGHEPGAVVTALLVWVRAGLTVDDIGRIIAVSNDDSLSGWRGRRGSEEGYEVKGFPPTRLLLQAVGPVQQAAPTLCGPARTWRSLTPYLPVRHWHRRRESLDEYVTKDVHTELGYRGLPAASVARLDPAERLPDLWALPFRRYRMDEDLGKARRGLGLRLEFAEEVPGPLLLGQLSHFGYGIFEPEPG